MQRAFISYSRKNQSFAERIAQDLSDAGLDIWLDLREIQVGEDWRTEIDRGLEQVDFLIACLSSPALDSEWVAYEIQQVHELGKAIFPIMVEDVFVALKAHPTLSWLLDIQHTVFEKRYEKAFVELLEALPGGRGLGVFDEFDPETIPNPFKGLQAFQQTDSALFFGREDLTRRVIGRIRNTNFFAIVGGSGSGKSSLVRAGIIPQIRQGAIEGSQSWPIVIITPGAHPLEAFARRMLPLLNENSDTQHTLEQVKARLLHPPRCGELVEWCLLGQPDDARLVIVIDQFEEVFARTGETERVRFVDLIRTLTVMESSRVQFIITMRADFFGNLSHTPDFANLFEQDHLLIVTEMTREHLLRAIEGPAQAVGLRYDSGLVERILNDVDSSPSALPLLQYALYELFKRRNGVRLTHAAYDEIGGVRQALARHAETLFLQMSIDQQAILGRLLLRMVDVSESGEITPRRLHRSEIRLQGVDEQSIQQILDKLTAPESRLVTVNHQIGNHVEDVVIQIGHEALIHEWDRFQAWIAASIDDLRHEAELRKAADNWETNERDEAYLLRGKRLIRAELWVDDHTATKLQQDFIIASITARDESEKQEQIRIARELRLQKRAFRAVLLLMGMIGILVVGLVIGLVVTITGLRTIERAEAEAVQQREAALLHADTAQRLALAAFAQQSYDDHDLDTALALAMIAAEGENPPAITRSVLADIALAPGTQHNLELAFGVSAIAISPDNHLIAIGSDAGLLVLVERETGEIFKQWQAHGEQISSLLFSADSSVLISGAVSQQENLIAWDVATGQQRIQLTAHENGVQAVARLLDGRVISMSETELILWDLRSRGFRRIQSGGADLQTMTEVAAHPQQPLLAIGGSRGSVGMLSVTNGIIWETLLGRSASVRSLTFHPDGDTVLVGLSDGSLFLLESRTGDIIEEVAGLGVRLVGVDFLPGQDTVLAIGKEDTLRLIDARSGQQEMAFNAGAVIQHFALSDDGTVLATNSITNHLRIWDLGHGARVGQWSAENRLSNIVLSSDNRLAALGTLEGAVQIREVGSHEVPSRWILSENEGISAVQFSRNDTQIAAGNLAGEIYILTIETGERQALTGHTDLVLALTYTPDGQYLVSGSADGSLILWNLETGEAIREFIGHQNGVSALAVTADSRRILSGDLHGRVFMWNLETGGRIASFDGHTRSIRSVDLNVSGDRALSASLDGTIRLWSVADGSEVRRFIGHAGTVQNAAFLPDESYILSGGRDGTVRFWQSDTGEEIRRYQAIGADGRLLPVEVQFLSNDGQYAISGLRGGDVQIWQVLASDADLLGWIAENRYVATLSCPDKLRFSIRGADHGGVFGQQAFVLKDTHLMSAALPDAPVSISIEIGEALSLLGIQKTDTETYFHVCMDSGVEGWLPEAFIKRNVIE